MFIDEAAEYRLLGSAIDSPDELLKWKETLFTGQRARLFHAMRESYLTYGEVSTEGVERFYGRNVPAELEIARGSKSAAVLDKLIDLATKRQLADLSEKLAITVNQQQFNRGEINKWLTLPPTISVEDSKLAPGIAEFVSDLNRKKEGKYRFVKTGLVFLDRMMGGEWQRQALTLVIGQSGSGKTALVCQSILNMARMGIPSLFFSLEMRRHRLVSRFIANMAHIDGLRLRTGEVDKQDTDVIDRSMAELQTLPIYIADDPHLTIDDICYQVKLHKESYGIEAFFVDYLQIVNTEGMREDNDVKVLGALTHRLRNIAIDTDTSAVVLAQQNRSYEGLKSISGSGKVGNIADTVLEIIADTQNTNDESRTCCIEFHKNRDGPIGKYQAFYRPKYLQFE